jgi:serine/threonine-protein kinase
MAQTDHGALRARQTLGKYRILRRVSAGGFATVYAAVDRIEGVRVALKIPHPHLMSDLVLEDFRREARVIARLDHPNILHIKNADHIEGRFVIVYPLAERTLTERLRYRLSTTKALHYAEQLIDAMAHAHARRVIHCDVKPDNVLLFAGDHICISDFGIARFIHKTMIDASGSGTVGYIAPEQAMGRPSFRSDCFSLGLVLYRMLTRELPAWPYRWPLPGAQTLRRKVHPQMVGFLRRALEVDEKKRYKDALQMERSWRQIKPRVMAHAQRRRWR